MKQLVKWSQGNPGALIFLMLLMEDNNLVHYLPIVMKLNECTTIRGTNLYVLYSDLCDRDISKVAELCIKCPNTILEEACSRQDWSGKELVAKYLS